MVVERKGLALPILRYKGGFFTSRSSFDLAWSEIILATGTRIGNRIHHPNFGCPTHDLLFDLLDDNLIQSSAQLIKASLEQSVELSEILDVYTNAESKTIEIMIVFQPFDEINPDTRGLMLERNPGFKLIQMLSNIG